MLTDDPVKLRRHLRDWLHYRITTGRTPFRRVEETPPVTAAGRPATPDLVLWVNRDSLLAGAMILIAHRDQPQSPEEDAAQAASLGLRQYVTWEASGVTLWEAGAGTVCSRQSWPVPAHSEDFAGTCEALFGELSRQAIAAVLPASQLPPAYFVNLCRQVLNDSAPALRAVARVAACNGQPEAETLRQAREQGWLTVWRLLALLWYERMPIGVRPERLARAIGYALADLPPMLARALLPVQNELSLPEDTAVRLHHLGGRLAQLGWCRDPERGRAILALLLDATAHDCQIDTAPLAAAPQPGILLVNHLPAQSLAGTRLVAPRPCLAGLALSANVVARPLPEQLVADLADLPAGYQPERVVATLASTTPLPPAGRRQRLAVLRQSWPYRRFRLATATPAWVWDALHLGGLVDSDGTLQLTLPAGWSAAPGAELLWQTISVRLALTTLQLHTDGQQTLTLVSHHRAPAALIFRDPTGTGRSVPALTGATGLATLAALAGGTALPANPPRRPARRHPAVAAAVAAKVFRDGIPDFPGQYLRRYDLPPLRTYRLPGPLRADSLFFDRVRLRGPDGSVLEAASAADAEALQLASHSGQPSIALPIDPLLTARLVVAYRADLQRLWQELVTECRSQHARQDRAMALARRLWQERRLPPVTRD